MFWNLRATALHHGHSHGFMWWREREPATEKQTMTTATPQTALPGGTRVLNTNDGEDGTVLNGYAFNAATGVCTEYEVETKYGIEKWLAADFITLEQANA